MSVSDMGGFYDNKGVFFGQAKKIKAGFLPAAGKLLTGLWIWGIVTEDGNSA